jgi:hypothetical protein
MYEILILIVNSVYEILIVISFFIVVLKDTLPNHIVMTHNKMRTIKN